MSLAIFISDGGEHVERARDLDQRVMRGERLEFIGRRNERQAGDLGSRGGKALGEAFLRIEAGADGGAALREGIEPRQRRFDARDAVLDLPRIGAEFRAEPQRRRVLQMRAADLDDVGEFLRLVCQRAAQRLERRAASGDRSPSPRRYASRSGSCRWMIGRD